MAQTFKTASMRTSLRPTGFLVADRGANSCYPSPPLGIRVRGANSPTNARAGGVRLEPSSDPSTFLLQTDGSAGARGYAFDKRTTEEERLMTKRLT